MGVHFPRSMGLVMACKGQSNLLLSHNHQAFPHSVRHVLHVWLSVGGNDVQPGTRAQDQPSQASTRAAIVIGGGPPQRRHKLVDANCHFI
jgi:hypothetical protein